MIVRQGFKIPRFRKFRIRGQALQNLQVRAPLGLRGVKHERTPLRLQVLRFDVPQRRILVLQLHLLLEPVLPATILHLDGRIALLAASPADVAGCSLAPAA